MPNPIGATFSNSVGYRGVVKVNKTILLATSGNINLSHQPIYASGVWGAGYMNASENVAYADNYLRLEGSIACYPTAGPVFDTIKLFAFTNRGATSGTPIAILPTGEQGFIGHGWCSSLSFSSSQDDVLTCDMNWTSFVNSRNTQGLTVDYNGVDTTNYDENRIVTGEPTAEMATLGASRGVLPMAYNGLYPYWGNEIYGGEKNGDVAPIWESLSDIINWSAEYSSSVEPLKCCGRGNSFQDDNDDFPAPLSPDYILLGAMTASGSFTVFKLQGDFNPDAYHKQKALKFVVKSPADTTGHTILIPTVVNAQGSSQVQTGASPITADFSFEAIGDGKNPPLALDPENDGGVSNNSIEDIE